MKPARLGLLLLLVGTAGCATLSPGTDGSSTDTTPAATTSSTPAPTDTSGGVEIILPSGGGPPEVAIPIGTGIYLPVDGSGVTTGVPVAP